MTARQAIAEASKLLQAERPGARMLILSPQQWTAVRTNIMFDVADHYRFGVWSPFTEELESATLDWLEESDGR